MEFLVLIRALLRVGVRDFFRVGVKVLRLVGVNVFFTGVRDLGRDGMLRYNLGI